MICKLALEDGAVFTGVGFGAAGTRTGEVIFNTAHTGYQEILTDPSYCGQIVVMTFPLIGNYGVNDEDAESSRPYLAGFVVKEACGRPSNHRASAGLAEWMARQCVVGIADVDTRALTRRIRTGGAVRGALSTEVLGDLELVRMARNADSMAGANLVPQVACREPYEWSAKNATRSTLAPTLSLEARRGAGPHIVALDCGIKHNILRRLCDNGCRVTVEPAHASAERIEALEPDGLIVGNGPGDPSAIRDTIDTLRLLIGRFPILGVCLGHQLLSLALGAETYKLRFGHHGANVPVLNRPSGRIEITSQNHGFAVETKSLERLGGRVTHVNLNDGSIEGFALPDRNLLAVQFHPEASPGPHDSAYLFDRFARAVGAKAAIDQSLFA